MLSWLDWLKLNWLDIAIPLVVFMAALLVLYRARKWAYNSFSRWAKKTGWTGDEIIVEAASTPSLIWVLILSIYLAVATAGFPDPWGNLISSGLWSLFVISICMAVIDIIQRLARFYSTRINISSQVLQTSLNISRILIFIVAFLTVLYIWGIPTTPILLLIAILVIAAVLIFQDMIPNLFAGIYLNTNRYFNVGDYIKLSSGEEGYVKAINLKNTLIEGLDESTVIIPNRKLMTSTIVNYGRPLKQASDPFRFLTKLHLTELTGLKARNIKEFCNILKQAPDSIIYYHTHHFLLQYNFLITQPTNDFAHWVSEIAGDQILGERLASIDSFEFPTIGALRDRLVNVTEEYISQRGNNFANVTEGNEFHFLKSVSIVLPTTYVAHDLRELIECLRKITYESLHFHIFESRLRLGKGLNDFSAWIGMAVGDEELAQQIARLDPYNFTLGGLRSRIIQLIEKRIK